MIMTLVLKILKYILFFALAVLFLILALALRTGFGWSTPVLIQPHSPLHFDFPDYAKGNASLFEAPLRTQGRDIVDKLHRRIKLASVNWYGASDEAFVPGGLDIRHRSEIARTIRDMGFNSVRLPYADELVYANPIVEARQLGANKDLLGRRALDVYAAVVEALTDEGIAVIVNNHITQATWCCGINPCDSAWFNYPYVGVFCRVKQTEEQWVENWETVMAMFVENPLVVGADLRNEPRGFWGTMLWPAWAAAAEKAGNRLLKMNPDWLIFVEGTSSSNDLAGVRARPVRLDVPNRVVYSSHVYSWSGWGSLEGMYNQRGYSSFAKSMDENWGYIVQENIAPVWVGEFGAPHIPPTGDMKYWENLMRYLDEMDADFGYWALNPRKFKNDDEETYGLLEDDWETPVMDYRLKSLVGLMK